jgi:IS5 family transposase
MKAKKATKKLKKAQLWLSDVVSQWSDLNSEARDLLNSAGESVHRALGLIDGAGSATATQATSGREDKGRDALVKRPGKRAFSEERKRKLSLAAKKRWAAAKRRGARTLAG